MKEDTKLIWSDHIGEDQDVNDNKSSVKREVVLLCISGLALVLHVVCKDFFPLDPAWITVLLCGLPILHDAVIGKVKRMDNGADFLVAIALIVLLIIRETFSAAVVAFIVQLGLKLGGREYY